LAKYLKYLNNNATAYNSYFKWKKNVIFSKDDIRVNSFRPICDMCIKLHLEDIDGIEHKVYNDLSGYWSKEKNCKSNPFYSG
jgi:hypothetical protein